MEARHVSLVRLPLQRGVDPCLLPWCHGGWLSEYARSLGPPFRSNRAHLYRTIILKPGLLLVGEGRHLVIVELERSPAHLVAQAAWDSLILLRLLRRVLGSRQLQNLLFLLFLLVLLSLPAVLTKVLGLLLDLRLIGELLGHGKPVVSALQGSGVVGLASAVHEEELLPDSLDSPVHRKAVVLPLSVRVKSVEVLSVVAASSLI